MSRGRWLRLAFLAALIVASLAAAGGGIAGGASPQKGKHPAVPGEIIVGFQPGLSVGQQTAILARAGAGKKRGLKHIHASVAGVPADQVDAVIKELTSTPGVRYAEPNHLLFADTTPNDPSFGALYGLNNTGQNVNGVAGTADADIDAPEAWSVTTGSPNVTVAVIDTGVDFGHPDLAPQQWINTGENCGSTDPTIVCAQRTDNSDNDGDGFVDDYRGWDFVNGDNNPFDDNNHGTHVAGTIGAVGNNGVGVTGINWAVKIMALKFLSGAGSGSTADAVDAITYAADHGAAVMNNSWGGGGYDQALRDAIAYAHSKNSLFVAAAGNDGVDTDSTAFYPSGYDNPNIVSVAATDNKDNLASFSNWGKTTVDLGAPGVDIYSTKPGNSYQYLSGTSMATPHVAGTAALIKARFPAATDLGIKALLLRSVDPKSSLNGKTTSNGRLNAFNAVSRSRCWPRTAPRPSVSPMSA
jgi:subtilisin family serine protease